MKVTSAELSNVIAHYGFISENTKITPLGNGHINTTLLVSGFIFENNIKKNKTIVLQKINHDVFKQPQQIIQNADFISQYLAKQQNYPLQNIPQLKTIDGKSSVIHGKNTWRALRFIEHSYTNDEVETVEQAKQVDMLKELKCQTVQGYYYSKPLSHPEFTAFLKSQLTKSAPSLIRSVNVN